MSARHAVEFGILPTELSAQEAAYYREEFLFWTLGNGLAELDQTYNRFLNAVIHTSMDVTEYKNPKGAYWIVQIW